MTPQELEQVFEANTGYSVWQVAGMEYNPLAGTWALGRNLSINYAACLVRMRAPGGRAAEDGAPEREHVQPTPSDAAVSEPAEQPVGQPAGQPVGASASNSDTPAAASNPDLAAGASTPDAPAGTQTPAGPVQ